MNTHKPASPFTQETPDFIRRAREEFIEPIDVTTNSIVPPDASVSDQKEANPYDLSPS